MKKRIVKRYIGICLMAVMFLSASAFAAQQQAGPKLVVPADHYAFGAVPEGTLVAHEFEIKNVGDAPLFLQKAVSSCSCLSVLSCDESVPPGETGRISVRFNSSGYGGDDVVRKVTIQTNDPVSPQVTVTVSGKVDKIYTISSEIVKLKGKVGDEVTGTVTICPEAPYDFQIVGLRMKKGEYIDCSYEECLMDGRKAWLLTIRGSKNEKGPFFDQIYLDTDSDVAPEISVGVFGKMEGA